MTTDQQKPDHSSVALGAIVRALTGAQQLPAPTNTGRNQFQGRSILANPRKSEFHAASENFKIGPGSSVVISEYGFLVGVAIDRADLSEAEELARVWSVPPHEVLLALGRLTPDEYASALAAALGIEVASDSSLRLVQRRPSLNSILTEGLATSATFGELHGRNCLLIDPLAFTPRAINQLLSRPDLATEQIVLATRKQMHQAIVTRHGRALTGAAVWGQARRKPSQSAAFGVPLRQAMTISASAGLALGAAAVVPGAAIAASTALLTLPFLAVVSLRSASLPTLFRGARDKSGVAQASPLTDAELPSYSILVALYREQTMLRQIVGALSQIDYPLAKLEIFLVLEETDQETREAAAAMTLPSCFEVIVVPDSSPRTKPKALNYALPFARGHLVVIFDAEDIPEPDQLRKAAAIFRAGPAELVCLQARLNIYNSRSNWLTRQFTIEYTALFDAILPTLANLGIPMPLGGTSNHFKASVLRTIGAWDPFNVTEDADLGVRLARHGFSCLVLDSTTWEQAPRGLGNWFKQRTRWLKGWMQTYLIHMRKPAELKRDLGIRGFVGFQAMIGGMILSALVHPLFYALLCLEFWNGRPFEMPETTVGRWMWGIAVANLMLGYAVSIALGAVAVARRGRYGLALHALVMPCYWLLISFAAYRGLYHLATDPHRWEKTEHTPRSPRQRKEG